MTCPSLEDLAAWLLGEKGDRDDTLEEHLFSCGACGANAAKLHALVHHLRTAPPPVLTVERRERLEKTADLPRIPVPPGGSAEIVFRPGVEVGLWLLRADLREVVRLDCELCAPDGQRLLALGDVPFDRERGEIVLACQVHFRHLGYPDELLVRISSVDESGPRPLGEYRLNHFVSDV